jgi:hypothetical protein
MVKMHCDMHLDVVGLKKFFKCRVDVVTLTKLALAIFVHASQRFQRVRIFLHDKGLDNHQGATAAVERPRDDIVEQGGMILGLIGEFGHSRSQYGRVGKEPFGQHRSLLHGCDV